MKPRAGHPLSGYKRICRATGWLSKQSFWGSLRYCLPKRLLARLASLHYEFKSIFPSAFTIPLGRGAVIKRKHWPLKSPVGPFPRRRRSRLGRLHTLLVCTSIRIWRLVLLQNAVVEVRNRHHRQGESANLAEIFLHVDVFAILFGPRIRTHAGFDAPVCLVNGIDGVVAPGCNDQNQSNALQSRLGRTRPRQIRWSGHRSRGRCQSPSTLYWR